MKRLLIVGAGGFGREVLAWAMDVNRSKQLWTGIAFLDARPYALAGFSCSAEIVGDPDTCVLSEVDELVCAIGDPRTKLRLCRHLRSRGGKFVTIVHPTAVVGPGCRVGQGCILCPGVVLTTNVLLGDFVSINLQATVGHDAIIGDGCTLSCHSDVTGQAVLGEGVFLGSHASILPGAHVGEYAKVGAGSVVLRKVPPGATVFGVPAQQISGFAEE